MSQLISRRSKRALLLALGMAAWTFSGQAFAQEQAAPAASPPPPLTAPAPVSAPANISLNVSANATPAATTPASTATPALPPSALPAIPAMPERQPPNLTPPSIGSLITLVLVYLLVLGGLGWLIVWIARRAGRLGGRSREDGLELIHQRMLGPKQVVAVLRYRDYDYVLGVTPTQITRLDVRPVEEAAAEARLAAENLLRGGEAPKKPEGK